MSNNLLHIIRHFFKGLDTASPHINARELYFRATILFGCSGVHAVYAYGTNKTENISIIKKYKIVSRGSTQFMVIDDKGRHFNVNNSLWYWKWDSLEDWAKINKGEYLQVKYYGIRSPLLGLFPNIVGYQ